MSSFNANEFVDETLRIPAKGDRMSRTAVSKDRILACRLTPDEERAVDTAAKSAGVSPARFLRNAVIDKLKIETTTARRTWAEEFAGLDKLDPSEAIAKFNGIRNGRSLPKGFMGMVRAEQIEWLDREWPL